MNRVKNKETCDSNQQTNNVEDGKKRAMGALDFFTLTSPEQNFFALSVQPHYGEDLILILKLASPTSPYLK